MPITSLDIAERSSFAGGKSFGDVGPYTLVEGTAHFAVDPLHPSNQAITDIGLAPRGPDGRVRFSSDFAMLQPTDPDRGRHRLLFDVVNRGRKTVLGTFNSAERGMQPTAPIEPGNGYLMRHGYTVVWCGWQADVPPTPGLMGMRAPEAIGPKGRLAGGILCQFQVEQPTEVLMLSHRDHLPHPPVDIDDPFAVLTVRDHPNGPAQHVARDLWSFVRVEDSQSEPEPSHVYMPSGFEPGRVYQLVYRTVGSTVVGLGFAAMRDIVSFLRRGSVEAGNPCAGDIERAHAFGASQSGRFLRHYIYEGMNEDEEGRPALDGIIPHVAGGMRGEFNLRFGQPSKDICYVIPELFPFTDTEQTDPVTGLTGSLMGCMRERGAAPKVMFTNTSAEYWRGDAALIHTDLETMSDAPELDSVRRYHFSGTQHGSGTFPPVVVREGDGIRGQLPFNCVDYTPLLRAALESLDRWVASNEPPPPSRHPSLSDGTAVESKTVLPRMAEIPGVRVPPETTRAMRLDYGPEAHLGRTTTLPAVRGEDYPALVSQVDGDSYNEVAGIRLPDLAVPVATYTGWNQRHPDIGNPDLYIGITGGLAGWVLPLHATREDREASSDPRPSIEERYQSREEYLSRVRAAAAALVDQRYMLQEDVEGVVRQAAERYDRFLEGSE